MNKQEFSMFAMALRTYYPRENIMPNNQAMELWFTQLEDLPYKVAEAALNKWVLTNKWSPAISDIRAMASDVKNGEDSDWGDAWQKVIRAISRYGMYRVDDAMESFDEITRQTVQRLGFKNICLSDNINQDRANFRMIYEELVKRKRTDEQITPKVNQLINSIQSIGIEDKNETR